MKPIFKTALFCLFTMIASESIAQIDLDDRALETFGPISTPSSSSLNVQNNLYDGTAIIGIPFFSESIDGVPINVSASYNTKGIKVDQLASQIGLGWNLNYGPSITRIVKDKIDELYIPQRVCTINPSNFTHTIIAQPAGVWMDKTGYSNFYTTVEDTEMDEFILSLPSGSIKFQFDYLGNLITIPYNDKIKIKRCWYIGGTEIGARIPVPANLADEIGEIMFKVTDESGNEYEFIPGDREEVTCAEECQLKHSESYECGSSIFKTNNWVINKITTVDQNVISYYYTEFHPQSLQLAYSQNIEERSWNNSFQVKEKISTFTGRLKFIERIVLPNNKLIDFIYTNDRCDVPNTKALDEIKITDKIADLHGVNQTYSREFKYKLNYAYFNSNVQSNAVGMPTVDEVSFPFTCQNFTSMDPLQLAFRLKLKSIDKVAGSSTEKFFDFEYESTRLPSRLSWKQDYFGYSNGEDYVDGTYYSGAIIPRIPKRNAFNISYQPYGVDRSPNINYAKGGILKKVKNGLGGETEFVYSQSIASFVPAIPTSNHTLLTSVDGLILTLKHERDGMNPENNTVTKYEYFISPVNANSSQQFFSKAISHFNVTQISSGSTYSSTVYANSLMTSQMPVNGSNHGFGEVTVSNYKGSTTNSSNFLASTEYYFSNANYNDFTATGIPTSNLLNSIATYWYVEYDEPPYTNKNYFRYWAMGLPVKTIQKDANGRVTAEVTLKYNVQDMYNNTPTPNLIQLNSRSIGKKYTDGNITEEYGEAYFPFTGIVKLVSKTTKDYVADNLSVAQTTNFLYNTNNTLSKTTTTNSKNETIESIVYYSNEWNSTSEGPGLASYNSKGLYVPVLTETWKTIGGVKRLLDVSSRGYDLVNNKVRSKNFYELITKDGLTQIAYTDGPSNFSMQTAAAGGTISNFLKTGYISKYSSTGLAEEIKSTNGPTVSKLYNNEKGWLLAEVYNAGYEDIAYTGFESYTTAIGINDENKGNWDFDPYAAYNATSTYPYLFAGRFVFKLQPSSSTANKITSTYPTTSGKDYYLTFWSKDVPPIVKEGNTSLSVQATEVAKSGWIQYEVKFTGQGNNVTVNADSGIGYIDDLRLHPVDAEMTTYSYEPLFGLSAVCDRSNRFTFFEYDNFGRKTLTRNHWGEIISKRTFVQQGND